MKNYISLLTKEDILNILQEKNYLLEEQLKNKNGDYLPSIERHKNSIIIRCKRIPNEEEMAIQNAILNSTQGKNIMLTLSFFDSFFSDKHTVVIIEDFNVYSFDTSYKDSNDEALFDSFFTYMKNKFGQEYIKDFKKYWKKEQTDENTNKKQTEDLSL